MHPKTLSFLRCCRRPSSDLLVVSLILLFISAESIVKAQSTSATLTGTVEDQNGAIIVGASVTVLNINTRLQREATTNEQGYFIVALLPPSTYTVTVRR